MDFNDVTVILKDAVMTVITVSGPILAIALTTGLVIAVFQATTQINEQTMTLIPKIIGVFTALTVLASWMVTQVSEYASELFENILRMIL